MADFPQSIADYIADLSDADFVNGGHRSNFIPSAQGTGNLARYVEQTAVDISEAADQVAADRAIVVDEAEIVKNAGALPRAGGAMTGTLDLAVEDLGSGSGTVAIDAATTNLKTYQQIGDTTYSPTNLIEGRAVQVNIDYQGGAIEAAGTVYWEMGSGEKSTNIGDLGLTLTVGHSYRLIFELVAGRVQGIIQ